MVIVIPLKRRVDPSLPRDVVDRDWARLLPERLVRFAGAV